MKLFYFGHSCFKLCTADGSVVLDPFDKPLPGIPVPELSADMALASHEHWDHNGLSHVKLTGKTPHLRLHQIDCFHDSVAGLLRGRNKISIVYAEGMSIVHLGDLGHELDKLQLSMLRTPDVLLLPVGGKYTIDAKTAKKLADNISPRIIIPMHYRTESKGLKELSPVSDFISLYPEGAVTRVGSSMDIDRRTESGIYLLDF